MHGPQSHAPTKQYLTSCYIVCSFLISICFTVTASTLSKEVFFQAARDGDDETLMACITSGIDVNTHDDKGCSALYVAAKYGKNTAIRHLLDAHANPNDQTTTGNTPLHIAAYNGHEETVLLLLRSGAPVNGTTYINRWTPLHFATVLGRKRIVEILIAHKGDIDARDSECCTAAYMAADKGFTNIFSMLIGAGANPVAQTGVDLWTPLHLASKRGYYDIAVILLYAAGIDPNPRTSKRYTPLHLAARKNRLDLIRALLSRHAELDLQDVEGNTPLMHAVRKGNHDIVTLLCQAGANVHAQAIGGCTPLHEAARAGHYDCLVTLLRYKANPESMTCAGTLPFHEAAISSRAQVLDRLRTYHTIDVLTSSKTTALELAARHGALSSVKYLLQNGAHYTLKEAKDGLIPLYLAAQFKKGDTMRYIFMHMATMKLFFSKSHIPSILAFTQGLVAPSALSQGPLPHEIIQRILLFTTPAQDFIICGAFCSYLWNSCFASIPEDSETKLSTLQTISQLCRSLLVRPLEYSDVLEHRLRKRIERATQEGHLNTYKQELMAGVPVDAIKRRINRHSIRVSAFAKILEKHLQGELS